MQLVKDLFDRSSLENLSPFKHEQIRFNNLATLMIHSDGTADLTWTTLPLSSLLEMITESDISVYRCILVDQGILHYNHRYLYVTT